MSQKTSGGFIAIEILLIAIVGISALSYLVIRLYTMISAMRVGRHCKKNSLSPTEAQAQFERFFNLENQDEIRLAGKQMFRALVAGAVLCPLIWFYGNESEQLEVTGTIITALFFIALIVYATGLITKMITLMSLPAGVTKLDTEELKTRLPFPKILVKYNARFFVCALVYAVEYWLFSV